MFLEIKSYIELYYMEYNRNAVVAAEFSIEIQFHWIDLVYIVEHWAVHII